MHKRNTLAYNTTRIAHNLLGVRHGWTRKAAHKTETPSGEEVPMTYLAAIIACWASRRDRNALILCLAVSLSVLYPLDPQGMEPYEWYIMLMWAEVTVACIALVFWSKSSSVVILTCLALSTLHIWQLFSAPYAEDPSVYPYIVETLEFILPLSILLTNIKLYPSHHGNHLSRAS